MIKIFILLFSSFAFASTNATSPFPIFLKMGFSSILEFEEVPTKVVLGDSQFFQVERLSNSIAIKTLTPYATTNMFVYFKTAPTKLFVLSASEDVEPTYYKKFEPVVPKAASAPVRSTIKYKRELKVLSAKFDDKKDYLTIEVQISSDSTQILKPEWARARLISNMKALEPKKMWSERKDVQKDSKIKARLIFFKPNLPRDLKGVSLVIPTAGSTKALTTSIKVGLQ